MKDIHRMESNDHKFLEDGGECGELIKAIDWDNTSLGNIKTWPISLRTTLGMILHSAFPMFFFWGDDLICFYNDAFRPSLGTDGKHPAIGKRGKEVWGEIWDFIGPLLHQVVTTAKPVSFADQLVPFYRNGRMEDIYWTFCYSAAYDDDGNVKGVVVTCTETTESVVAKKELQESERRLRSMISQAPVSIGIFRGKEHVTRMANSRALELWGRKAEDVINRPISDAMPELKTQGVRELLDTVYTTGEIFRVNELPVQLERNGTLGTAYINFTYEPTYNSSSEIEGVMAIGIDVTDQVIARKKIEESEKKYKELIYSLPAAVYTCDAEGYIQLFNESAVMLWGQAPQVGKDLWCGPWKIYNTDGTPLPVEDCPMAIALKEGRILNPELIIERPDGTRRNIIPYPQLTYDSSGKLMGAVNTLVDITEQVLTSQKNKESEDRFRAIADNIPNLAWMANAEGWIYWYNKKWYDYTGKTPQEMEGWGWQSVHDPAVLPEVLTKWRFAIERGQPFEMIFPIRGADAKFRQFLTRVLPVHDEEGKILKWFGSNTDITEQVEAQKRVEASELRFSNILSQSLLAVCILKGEEMLVTSANDAIIEIWGKGDDVIGKPLMEVLPELDGQIIPKLLHDVYTTGVPFVTSEIKVMLVRNGKPEECYFNLIYQPFREIDNSITGITVFATEITLQVHAKKQLEESEKKFRLLADSMPQHIWTADPQGKLNYFNQSVFDYSGLSHEQLIKEGWIEIVHPNDREKNIKAWSDAVLKGTDFLFEHRFRRHDGVYRWQLSRAKPQRDEHGNIKMWVGTSTDIQEQKNFRDELEKQVKERTAELESLNETLKKSEERYHLMVEEVQDYAILYLNRDGIVENWNTGAEKIKGYKAEEIIGKSFSNFYTKEDRESQLPLKLLGTAEKSGRALQEGWRVRKDGTLFWASVVITAIHNEADEVIGFSKVTHDLTEKKEANDALLNKQLELEQKNTELQKLNKELQSFAYISSHDLQEPLRKIQTFASRIAEIDQDTLSEKGKDLFNRMQASAERMQALIDDLLAYSRTQNLEKDFQKINLKDVVEKVRLDLKEEILDRNATIDTNHLACEVAIIPFQFHQLFYNLISNSLKFSDPKRPLQITIRNEYVKGKAENGMDENKNYHHISVADNGIGFEQKYSERIFELFQRLHGNREYQGTGIGLAIIKRIVENHNGLITASGELGVGATFDIYLPDNIE